jgi:hypothetical protein
MNKRIRRQCYDLTVADLDAYPCWEFAIDEEGRRGQDEATVRPVSPVHSLRELSGPIITLAVFCFPNGRVRSGQLTIGAGDTLSDIQPSLLLDDGPLNFYVGSFRPSIRDLGRTRKRLQAISSTIFPIQFFTGLYDRKGLPLCAGSIEGLYEFAGFGKKPKKLVLT